jgi:hypothetical protein
MTDKERRFWEKCGFKHTYQLESFYGSPVKKRVAYWLYPDGTQRQALPDINSLDDLITYGCKDIYYIEIKMAGYLEYKSVMVQKTRDSEPQYAQAKKVAAALFEALCKALEVEG